MTSEHDRARRWKLKREAAQNYVERLGLADGALRRRDDDDEQP